MECKVGKSEGEKKSVEQRGEFVDDVKCSKTFKKQNQALYFDA